MGDEIVVSRTIRTRAAFEGASVSSEKVLIIVSLPLFMRVDKGISKAPMLQDEAIPRLEASALDQIISGSIVGASVVSAKPDQTGSVLLPLETPIPPTSLPISKSKKFNGRIIAVIGALAVLVLAVLIGLRRQTGVQTATRPPVQQESGPPPPADKTLQDALDRANQEAKKSGPRPSAGKKPQNDNDKEQEALREALKQSRQSQPFSTGGEQALVPRNDDQASEIVDTNLNDIDILIKQLSTAFSHRSVSELQNIWPQMGDEDKVVIEQEFNSVQTINRTFDVKTFGFTPDKQMATLTGVYHDTIIANGKKTKKEGGFVLLLVKTSDKWLIREAKFTPDSSVIRK